MKRLKTNCPARRQKHFRQIGVRLFFASTLLLEISSVSVAAPNEMVQALNLCNSIADDVIAQTNSDVTPTTLFPRAVVTLVSLNVAIKKIIARTRSDRPEIISAACAFFLKGRFPEAGAKSESLADLSQFVASKFGASERDLTELAIADQEVSMALSALKNLGTRVEIAGTEHSQFPWRRIDTRLADLRPSSPDGLLMASQIEDVKSKGALTGSTRTAYENSVVDFWESSAKNNAVLVSVFNSFARQLSEEEKWDLADALSHNINLNTAMFFGFRNCTNIEAGAQNWLRSPAQMIKIRETVQKATDGMGASPGNFWEPRIAVEKADDNGGSSSRWSFNTAACVAQSAAVYLQVISKSQTLKIVADHPGSLGKVRNFINYLEVAKEVAETQVLGGLDFRFSILAGMAVGEYSGCKALKYFGNASRLPSYKYYCDRYSGFYELSKQLELVEARANAAPSSADSVEPVKSVENSSVKAYSKTPLYEIELGNVTNPSDRKIHLQFRNVRLHLKTERVGQNSMFILCQSDKADLSKREIMYERYAGAKPFTVNFEKNALLDANCSVSIPAGYVVSVAAEVVKIRIDQVKYHTKLNVKSGNIHVIPSLALETFLVAKGKLGDEAKKFNVGAGKSISIKATTENGVVTYDEPRDSYSGQGPTTGTEKNENKVIYSDNPFFRVLP